MPSNSQHRRAPFGRRTFLAGVTGLAGLGAVARAQTSPPPPLPDEWSRAETLPLWPNGTPGGGYVAAKPGPNWRPNWVRNVDQPLLHVFRPKVPNGRALLSLPGGAYTFVSILNEGVDMARDMTARGYTVFVLTYRLPGEGWHDRADVPLQDTQRAMRVIRANARRYGFAPEAVAVVGFSAGGHLAATLATGYDEKVYAPRDTNDAIDARPALVGLVYPVISLSAPVTHAESALRLLGEHPAPDLVARRSPAAHVTVLTPPAFIVHCLDDPAVPPENSRIMEGALRAVSRPVEVHLFEEGGHGFGLGPANRPVSLWSTLFAAWLERHFAPSG